MSRLASCAGSRAWSPLAAESPGAPSWLRLLKLLTVAELHSHDVWPVVPAVAGVTVNAATRAATRMPSQSGARRIMLFSTVPPKFELHFEA